MAIQLSAVDVLYLVKELQSLTDSRIDQIYQYSPTSVMIRFHKSQTGKQDLLIDIPKWIYLSQKKQDSPEDIMNFCAYLRKTISGMFVKNVQQLDFNRVIAITLNIKDKEHVLCVELYDKGNIILCHKEANTLIIDVPLQVQQWSGRSIKKGEKYIPQNVQFPQSLSTQQIQEIINTEPKTAISRVLTSKFGLGGWYASIACSFASIDPQIPAEKTNASQIKTALEKIFTQPIKPRIICKGEPLIQNAIHIVPFEYSLPDHSHIDCQTISEAYEKCHGVVAPQAPKLKAFDEKLAKIQAIYDSQKKSIDTLQAEIEENSKTGEYIYEKYQELQETISQFLKIKDLPESQLKSEIKKLNIKSYSFKDRTFTIEI